MKTFRVDQWGFGCVAALAALLLVASYSNYFHNPFHFDDSHVVEENLYIRSLGNVFHFFSDAGTSSSLPANAVYRPLVPLTLALDYQRGGGLEPWQFRLTQLSLLGLLGVLLVPFYFHLIPSNARRWWHKYLALYAGTLYCLHPTHTETMNIISHRSELLSAIGIVGAFLMYCHFPRGRRFGLYLIPAVIGALAKLPSVMFAPLLLMYRLLCEEQLSLPQAFQGAHRASVRRAVVGSLPAFLVMGATFVFVRGMRHPEADLANTDRLAYVVTQPFVWLRYVRLFFIPTGLTADTDWKVLEHWADPRFLAGSCCILFLVAMIWLTSKKASLRPAAFGLSWFGITLLPTSSIIPLAEVTNDHRVFLPYVGLTWAVVGMVQVGIQNVARRRRRLATPTIAWAVGAMIVLGYAGGTYARNRVWKDGETLWLDVTRKSPANGRGLMNYGLTQMAKGEYERALEYFERARTYNPNYSTLEINLGILHGARGDAVAAESHFKRAIVLAPRYHQAYYFYARWLTGQQRAPEAIEHLRTAIDLSPGNANALHLLMGVYAALGDRSAVDTLVRRLRQIDRQDAMAQSYAARWSPRTPGTSFDSYFRLGSRLINQGNYLEAAQVTRQALEITPDSADALNNLGWALANLGFFREAETYLERSVTIRPGFDLAWANLEWVRKQATGG